ncbi:unnamed protein product [Cladocopium goreaui]|uniref:Phytase-like domain-containing protein n=1 Tax=Cladocopium goreaui TaxID=2562237 RepID=A0A9P1D1N3_9DINO|nr:unnamed protein product [Cladocopium goreaui]
MADGVFGAVDHVSSIFLPFGATSPQGQRIYGISACLLAPDLQTLLLLCDMGAIYGARVDFQGLKLSNISWKHWTEITSDDQWGVPMAMDVEGMALDNGTGEVLLSSERPSHFFRLPVPWQSFVNPDSGNVTKAVWLPHQPSFVEENEVSNKGLEAFTASANHTFLAGVEGALENDDPAVRRIYQVDSSGRSLWSGFLMVDTFPSHPLGLTELAAVNLPNQSGGPHFLSLERRFSRAEENDIRLYLLDLAGASNVSNCSAICDGPCDLRGEHQCDLDELTSIQKRLVFQWTPTQLLGGLMVDNYEAMTIIPPQAVGYESVEDLGGLAVLLINDNNDNPRQIGTQFVLLRLPFATAGEPTRWPRIMLLLVVLPVLVALCSLCTVFLLCPKARRRCRRLGRRVRHQTFEDDDPPVDAGVSKLGRPVAV